MCVLDTNVNLRELEISDILKYNIIQLYVTGRQVLIRGFKRLELIKSLKPTKLQIKTWFQTVFLFCENCNEPVEK